MGKKKQNQKRSSMNTSVSLIEEDANSSCNSLNPSSISLKHSMVPENLTISGSDPVGHNTYPEKLIVSSAESAKCDTYVKWCLKSHFKYVVFLHPSVMMSHNILNLLIVQGEEKKMLCLAHPLDFLKRSLIVFPKECIFKDQERVSLFPYLGKERKAKEIFIQSNKEEILGDNEKQVILKLLCHKYIYAGLTVDWTFGHKCYTGIIKDIKASCDVPDPNLNETSPAVEYYVVYDKTAIKLESEASESDTKHCESKTSELPYLVGLEKQMIALNKHAQQCYKSKNGVDTSHLTPEELFAKLKQMSKTFKPSAMADFKCEVPKIKWSDIGGMHVVKKALLEMVDLKLLEEIRKAKMSTKRGVLLYGPSGCSKTMIAAALASESNFNFISVKCPELFGKYVGETESAMSQLFTKARAASPCIIFFDEFDTIASTRGSTSGSSDVADRLLNQLLIEMEGIDVLEKPVHIIAATNRPQIIDESLLRPGRFDKLIYVPLPDSAARREIIENRLRKRPVANDVSVAELVDATKGYTGAEIVEVLSEATWYAITDVFESKLDLHSAAVTRDQFITALKHVKPRTTQEILQSYEAFNIRRKC